MSEHIDNQEEFNEEDIYYCPVCMDEEKGVKRELIRREGQFGLFWGCSGYRDEACSATFQDWLGAPQLPSKDHKCKSCDSGYMQRHKGSHGWYWRCDNEDCRKTAKDKHGDIVYLDVTEHACPACGEGYLIRRKSQNPNSTSKHWYGCNQFPKCSYKTVEYQGKPDLLKGKTNDSEDKE